MAALDRKHGEKSLDITAAAVHFFFLKFVYYPYSSLAIRGRSCRKDKKMVGAFSRIQNTGRMLNPNSE